MFQGSNMIQVIAIAALPLLFGITLHEAAHGWVASKFGDKTAMMLGRVTLNPAKHIDWFGTIILPTILLLLGGFIFGWAKPVPITQQNLKNPKRDMALVALAGPFTNLIMAFLWAIVAKLGNVILASATTPMLLSTAKFFALTGRFGIMINIVLFILNLIPIPPLDGSRVISSILSNRVAAVYEKIEPWGIWVLLALLMLGALRYILIPPVIMMTQWISRLFGLGT